MKIKSLGECPTLSSDNVAVNLADLQVSELSSEDRLKLIAQEVVRLIENKAAIARMEERARIAYETEMREETRRLALNQLKALIQGLREKIEEAQEKGIDPRKIVSWGKIMSRAQEELKKHEKKTPKMNRIQSATQNAFAPNGEKVVQVKAWELDHLKSCCEDRMANERAQDKSQKNETSQKTNGMGCSACPSQGMGIVKVDRMDPRPDMSRVREAMRSNSMSGYGSFSVRSDVDPSFSGRRSGDPQLRQDRSDPGLGSWWDDLWSGSSEEAPQTPEEALRLANEKTAELDATQKKVDRLLELLPENHPEYERLMSEKNASRGFFSEYIVPAWKTLQDAVGLGEDVNQQGMGLIPLAILGAGALGAAAIITASVAYVKVASDAIEREKRILEDPSIPEDVRRKLLMQDAGVMGILMSAQGLIVTGIAAYGAYWALSRMKKA